MEKYVTLAVPGLAILPGCKSYLDVSPQSVSAGPESGDAAITISSNTAWTVSDNADWLAVSPETDTWTSAASLLKARWGHIAEEVGGTGSPSVFKYDIDAAAWSKITDLSMGRWGNSSRSYDTLIFCMGGYVSGTDGGQRLVEAINIRTEEVTKLDNLLSCTATCSVCLLEESI